MGSWSQSGTQIFNRPITQPAQYWMHTTIFCMQVLTYLLLSNEEAEQYKPLRKPYLLLKCILCTWSITTTPTYPKFTPPKWQAFVEFQCSLAVMRQQVKWKGEAWSFLWHFCSQTPLSANKLPCTPYGYTGSEELQTLTQLVFHTHFFF